MKTKTNSQGLEGKQAGITAPPCHISWDIVEYLLATKPNKTNQWLNYNKQMLPKTEEIAWNSI